MPREDTPRLEERPKIPLLDYPDSPIDTSPDSLARHESEVLRRRDENNTRRVAAKTHDFLSRFDVREILGADGVVYQVLALDVARDDVAASTSIPWGVTVGADSISIDGGAELYVGEDSREPWNDGTVNVIAGYDNTTGFTSSPPGLSYPTATGDYLAFKVEQNASLVITDISLVRRTSSDDVYTTTGSPARIDAIWLPICTFAIVDGVVSVANQLLRSQGWLMPRIVDGMGAWWFAQH